MKKVFYLAAFFTAALATVSCSNNEMMESADTSQANAIGFKTYVPKAQVNSRGTALGTGDTGFDFDVFAISEDGKIEMGSPSTGPATDGVQIVYDNGKSIWKYNDASETKFWPNDDSKLNFYAISPATLPAGTAAETLVKSIASGTAALSRSFTYTAPLNSSLQSDVMVSEVLGAKKSVRGGETINGTASASPTSDKVPFIFQHALAQIVFQAKTAAAGYTIDIENIKLYNIQAKGTFDFTTYSSRAWSFPADADKVYGTFDTQMSAKKDISTTAKSLTSSVDNTALLLIPEQNVTPWGTTSKAAKPITSTDPNVKTANSDKESYLEISCKMKDTSTGKYLIGSDAAYVKIYIPFAVATQGVAASWVKSTKYTYTIVFGDSAGQGGGGGFDQDGKPLNVPIEFTASVTDWTDATGVETINM